jgi:anti-sigma factor RsiW
MTTTAAEMSCRDLVVLVTTYLDGSLSPAERQRFEAHLALCPGCDTYLEQMRLTVRLLGALREEDLHPIPRRRLLAAFRGWAERRR